MITTEKLKKLNHIGVIGGVTYIAILLFYNHYYSPVSLNYFYVTIPFIVLLYISKIIIIKRNKIEAQFSIKLSPEQYEKVNKEARKQNKSVNQFCADIIDEKLNEKNHN